MRRCGCSTSSSSAPRRSPPATWRRASSTACSIRTISTSPARASITARGASTPTWDPAFTAAYFDHAGLYAFGRQPEAIHWDVDAARRVAAPDRRGRAADRGARHLWRALSARGVRSDPVAARRRRRATPSSDRALVQAIERGAARAPRRRSTASSSTRSAARCPTAMASLRRSPRGARRLCAAQGPRDHSLLVGRALLDADRRGRGDLGGDRPSATIGRRSTPRSRAIRADGRSAALTARLREPR